jgi:hypothetical protein
MTGNLNRLYADLLDARFGVRKFGCIVRGHA